MANSFVPNHIRTVDGNLILEATAGDVILQAGSAITPTTVVDIQGGITVATANINSATAPTIANSGTFYSVDQVNTGAYAITLPNDALPGTFFKFMINTADSDNVTITNGANELAGTIINDVTSVLPVAGTTLTFVGGTAARGDSIEIYAINATLYWVKCITSTAGGITIT